MKLMRPNDADRKQVIAFGMIAALLSACGGPDFNRPLSASEIAAERADIASRTPPTAAERADFAVCSYQSVAATAAEPGLLMPAFDQIHLRDICMRARAAAREAGQPPD